MKNTKIGISLYIGKIAIDKIKQLILWKKTLRLFV